MFLFYYLGKLRVECSSSWLYKVLLLYNNCFFCILEFCVCENTNNTTEEKKKEHQWMKLQVKMDEKRRKALLKIERILDWCNRHDDYEKKKKRKNLIIWSFKQNLNYTILIIIIFSVCYDDCRLVVVDIYENSWDNNNNDFLLTL